ncbi:helix-turn-helix domain-containing protein [Palleronia caenipelagi]|uniref:Helix-turn-helix transcriptional regulator n=1 Tax=Palleronia caenipelagi TaxID=2489174 RepID=A0A547Q675_9RHOB|nr:helix-turn-helix transcriptional regulator [Palleronia caenipelagi]TRD21887.1 helix-turn-helix transcriptional regulator [Palleronia caenipelagi]
METQVENNLPADLRAEMAPERIGFRLGLLREYLGKSPSEMADSLDIPRTYWSRFERGRRPVSDTVAALLVSRFGVTLDFLMLGRWDKLPVDMADGMREILSKKS